jgi:hypothetical protein
VVRALRKCIPYHAPDISPFERPLTSPELQRFARPFAKMTARAFSLPFVNAAQALPPLRRYLFAAYRQDAVVLRRFPVLTFLAGIRVFEVVK